MEKSKDFEAILASNADLTPHGVALGADPPGLPPGASNFANSKTENLKNSLLKYPDSINLKELIDYDSKLQEAKDSGVLFSPW